MFFTDTGFFDHDCLRVSQRAISAVGIAPSSIAWGVWVEGYGGVESARFNPDAATSQAQAPHLVISAVHPDQWCTSFVLRAYLDRWPHLRPDKWPSNDLIHTSRDPVRGICHALALLGVNLVMVKISQIGFGVQMFEAICELPEHRAFASKERELLDQKLTEIYSDSFSKVSASNGVEEARERTMGRIASRLVRDVADLETQLIAINTLRVAADRDAIERLTLTQPEQLQAVYESITGRLMRPEQLSALLQLQRMDPKQRGTPAWLACNRWNIMGAGPFLAKRSLRSGRMPLYTTLEEVWGTKTDVDAAKAALRRRRTAGERTPEQEAYNRFEMLQRELGATWMRPFDAWLATRSTQEKAAFAGQKWELVRRWSAEETLRRQEVPPVSSQIMRSLMHSAIWRCWWNGELCDAQQFRVKPMAVERDKGRRKTAASKPAEPAAQPAPDWYRLEPVHDNLTSSNIVGEMRDFLNKATTPLYTTIYHEFDDPAKIMVNVDEPARCLRVRFLNKSFEQSQMMRLTVKYSMNPKAQESGDAHGMLAAVLAVFDDLGLHVEHLDNSIGADGDRKNTTATGDEKGEVNVIFRAVSKAAAVYTMGEVNDAKQAARMTALAERIKNAVKQGTNDRVKVDDIDMSMHSI